MRKANIAKPAGCHTFRHSFAGTLLAGATFALLGHADAKTTMIYTHVLNPAGGWCGLQSPLQANGGTICGL